MAEQTEVTTPQETTDRQMVSQAMQEMYGTETKAPDQDPTPETQTPVVEKGEGDDAADLPKVEQKEEKPLGDDPKPSKEEQTIGKLTRLKKQKTELREKNKELETKLAELQAKLETAERLKGEAPEASKYADQAALERDRTKHELKTEIITDDVARLQKEVEAQKTLDWNTRIQEQVDDYDGFRLKYQHYAPFVAKAEPELTSIANESGVGPLILEAVFEIYQTPQKLAVWQQMSGRAKESMLVNLEQRLLAGRTGQESQAPSPGVSAAPKSIAPEKAASTGISTGMSDRDLVSKAMREMYAS